MVGKGLTVGQRVHLCCVCLNVLHGYFYHVSFYVLCPLLIPLQHQGLFGQNAKNAKHALNKAERKLIIIFTYYMVFATLTLVYYSIVTGNYDNFEEAVIDYFSCEAGGYNPVSPCPKDYEQYTYPELQATIYIVMGFIPSVNLIYVIDVQRMRKEVTEWFPSLSHALSKSNLDSSPNRAKSNLSSFAESKNFVSIVT